MQRILVINCKGGCGKTTIATNLAGYYAQAGRPAALLDHDPQGSTNRWLELRPRQLAPIHGVFAHDALKPGLTRAYALRMPPDTERVVVDTPASMKTLEILDMMRGAGAVLVPVLPSAIDSHVTLAFLENLDRLCRQAIPGVPVGIVANRVRFNTRAFRQLQGILQEVQFPLVATLRDTQNYVQAAEMGRCVHELHTRSAKRDLELWQPLIQWLETGRTESRAASATPERAAPTRGIAGLANPQFV